MKLRPVFPTIALSAIAIACTACDKGSSQPAPDGPDASTDADTDADTDTETGTHTEYEPDEESLAGHPLPEWFAGAKLGIMVTIGLYSVPGWAPLTGELNEVLAEHDWAYWFANNPYTEWYENSLEVPGSATREHHDQNWGADFAYEQFQPLFEEQIAALDAASWAELFSSAGARYVVLTTKHHDGYTLWPSAIENPNVDGYSSEADIVGQVADAVREAGMRFGIYYSGGLDWTFESDPIASEIDLFSSIPQGEDYVQYATEQWRELIDLYQPRLLWNDLGYPAAGEDDLLELFADYYNEIPDGVVNDRFHLAGLGHHDYVVVEYGYGSEEVADGKWESTRGFGYSFGYNRLDDEQVCISADELVRLLVRVVSDNGNLLINVGPTAAGEIPALQEQRLSELGAWLDDNGEAIFETAVNEPAQATSEAGIELRFTRSDEALYAVLLQTPESDTVIVPDLEPPAQAVIELLATGQQLGWTVAGGDLEISLPAQLPDQAAHALSISPPPE